MSLKGFHIVFVTVSTLLCVFLALWSFLLAPEPSGMATALGIIGIAGSVLMPAYGVYFYRKITRHSI
jgi:hypothetical protein